MFGTSNFGTEVTWVPSCGLETKLIFGTEILVSKFVYPVQASPNPYYVRIVRQIQRSEFNDLIRDFRLVLVIQSGWSFPRPFVPYFFLGRPDS